MKKPGWKRYLDFWGRDLEREVEDEFEFHLDMRVRELEEQGLDPRSARRQALECFGPRQPLTHECVRQHQRWEREVRMQSFFNHLGRDVVYALRQFRTRRVATLSVVAILAVGIGINMAVFSLVHSILLAPLPYSNPEELVRIWDRNVESDLLFFSVSVPHLIAWKEAESLASIGAYREDSFNLRADSGVESIRGARITPELLDVLGIQASLGRNLTPEDDVPGAPPAIMLSHISWQRIYGGREQAIGRAVILDGRSYQIVGVLPADFIFPEHSGLELLVPYQLGPEAATQTAHFLRVLARLEQGSSLEAMTSELNSLAAAADETLGAGEAGWTAVALDLKTAATFEARDPLLLLFVVVAALLLITCANVSQLYLVQGASRRSEFAVRVALGAGRGALIRQLSVELLVVSLVGAVAGVLLGWSGQGILLTLLPGDLARQEEAVFGWEVALCGFGLALVCGLLMAAIQARSLRLAVRPVLNTRQEAAVSARLVRFLVAVEVAVSLALLVGGAILTQSFLKLAEIDPGFASTDVARASITALASTREQAPERTRLLQQLWEGMKQVEGVQDVALVHRLPLDGNSAITLLPRDQADPDGEPFWVNYRSVSPGYFATLSVPFLQGRDYQPAEAWQQSDAIVINRALARVFWPGLGEVVGKRLGMSAQGPWFEVVGVVADVQEDELSSPPQPAAYLSYATAPVPAMELLVRGQRSAADMGREAQRTLASIAPHQAMSPFLPLDHFMRNLQAQPRSGSLLVSIFAVLATGLSLLGVMVLVSTAIAARKHELGVRLVLGATPRGVVRLALRDGLLSAIAGVPLGLGVALLGSRWLSAHVHGISATDPATYAAAALVLIAAATLAAYVPSRRAARIDPRRILG